jgi:hypothetical protein
MRTPTRRTQRLEGGRQDLLVNGGRPLPLDKDVGPAGHKEQKR